MKRFIISLIAFIPFAGSGQSSIHQANDTIIYYKQDQPAYCFDLAGKNQKLFFDSVIYDNKRPITVFVRNNTPNLITIYPRYHANTFWKHSNKLYIEPGAYFKAELIVSEGEKFKRIGRLTGYLKIDYWDGPKSARKQFKLVLKGKVGLGTLPPFKNEKTTPNENPSLNESSASEGSAIPKQKDPLRPDTVITLKIYDRIYSDTLPLPIPGKYDTLPYREDKVWINVDFYTQKEDSRTTQVNRKVFVDGTVLEYYKDGKLYSKRTRVDSSDLQPYFTSYHQNGKLWTEQFISQTIEYAENGRKRSNIKDEVKTIFFDNGKIASIEHLGKKRHGSAPFLTEFYFKTGCKAKEVSEHNFSAVGQTEINYREDICNCPKSKINNTAKIYYKNCVEAGKIITRNLPLEKTGEFDSLLTLINGKEEIGSYLGKNRAYCFYKSNNRYLPEFTYRRNTDIGNSQSYDSIFPIKFNQVKNTKKHGLWIDCNLSTEEFVDKLISFEQGAIGKPEMGYIEYIYQYPWKLYEQGRLIETQYYSKQGDIKKRIKYQGSDSAIIHYEYKLQLDSTIISIDSPFIIDHSRADTVTYYSYRLKHTVLVYENHELRQKTSPLFKTEHYTTTPQVVPAGDFGGMVSTIGVHSSGIRDVSLSFTIEKGEFGNLKLYNGTRSHYNEKTKLIKIVTVLNGEENTGNK